MPRPFSDRLAPALPLAVAAAALGQAGQPAVFVANNGNLEGSVSSFTLSDSDQPVLVQNLLIGGEDDPGTNPANLSLTPDGRFLAAGHATGADDVEQLTIIEVHEDATLAIAGEFTTTDSPLAVEWIDDELLAVSHTDLSADNEVLVYHYDRDANDLTLVDSAIAGSFLTAIAVRDDGAVLYANDSFGNAVYAFEVAPDGTLTALQTAFTGGPYPLGIELSPDGTHLYGGGGISADGDKVVGFNAAPDGTLTLAPGSPFTSPGESPKGFSFSEDGSFLFVQHGTDSTIRVMEVDAETGALANTGFAYDVGFQGTLGGTDVLGDLLLVTDESTIFDDVRGLRALAIGEDGSLTPTGPIVDTGGVTPESVVAWAGAACPADFNGDGSLDVLDFIALQNAFQAGDPDADINGDGELDILDFIAFQALFAEGCP